MASAYASKSLKQTLEKVQNISHTRVAVVSMDLGAVSEDDKTNEQLMLLEDAIEKDVLFDFLIQTAMMK